jgi:gas vesicle protein
LLFEPAGREKTMAELEKSEVRESKKSNNVLAAIVGFGAGAVVGAVTALLYAPQSGKETRDKIKDRVGDISEKAADMIDKSKEAFEEAKDKMSTAYEKAVEQTTSAIEQAKGKLGPKKDKAEE